MMRRMLLENCPNIYIKNKWNICKNNIISLKHDLSAIYQLTECADEHTVKMALQ